MSDKEPRIGVFICECGGNISDVIDVKNIKGKVVKEHGVITAKTHTFLCSKPGLELIKKSIKSKDLDRVVIASCTAKMHKELFRKNAKEMGLNEYLVNRVNIREHGSWVHHDDPKGANEKAYDMVRAGVAQVAYASPLEPQVVDIKNSALVIGGGIAGITTSLTLADAGYKVYLVERNPSIGGNAIRYPKVFPTLDCAQCILTPKMVEVANNSNIIILTYSEVESVNGSAGNYHVKVRMKPRGVDQETCTKCGVCSKICPVEVPSEYDEGLGNRKAIYIPFPQAIPPVYTIDFESCTKCGECVRRCPSKSINLEDEGKTAEFDVGAISLNTGFRLYDLEAYPELNLDHPNSITALQMERMMDVTGPTAGRIIRPSDGKDVRKMAFILCAGSRDVQKGYPYCSLVCCLYAIKQARILKEHFHIDIWIHFIDIRTPGRRYEEFYRVARMEEINFVRGKVSETVPDGDTILVRAEDTVLGRAVENEVDLVVLCPAILPSDGSVDLASMLKVPLGEDDFVLEAHPKLDPVSTKREGIYAAGAATGPKDIQYTVAESSGAAAEMIKFLGKGVKTIDPFKAYLKKPEVCDGCKVCVEACPADAFSIEEGKAVIDTILCNGCGVCVPLCPYDALDMTSPDNRQLSAQIEATLSLPSEKTKILCFIEENISYTAADIAGINRLLYPSNVRFIPIASNARLKLKHILYAFAKGADGVLLAEAPPEGPLGMAHYLARERFKEYRKELRRFGIESRRFRFTEVFVPNWGKLVQTFRSFSEIINSLGPLELEVRDKLADEPLLRSMVIGG